MKKKWLTVLIICVALMFAWIFLAVALTGGRDVADFTQRDKQIMLGFAVVEFVTVAVMLVSACILGKQPRPYSGAQIQHQSAELCR